MRSLLQNAVFSKAGLTAIFPRLISIALKFFAAVLTGEFVKGFFVHGVLVIPPPGKAAGIAAKELLLALWILGDDLAAAFAQAKCVLPAAHTTQGVAQAVGLDGAAGSAGQLRNLRIALAGEAQCGNLLFLRCAQACACTARRFLVCLSFRWKTPFRQCHSIALRP